MHGCLLSQVIAGLKAKRFPGEGLPYKNDGAARLKF